LKVRTASPRCGEQEKRELLQGTACRSRNLDAGKSRQRPEIQQQQNKWQRHQHRLGHQAEREENQGGPKTAAAIFLRIFGVT
jgi:hypothetical protein